MNPIHVSSLLIANITIDGESGATNDRKIRALMTFVRAKI